MPFPPVAGFPPLVDSRPVADTPAVELYPAYPVAYPRLRRRPSRRVVLAGLGALVGILAIGGGVLLLGGGGDDPTGTEIPPPAQASLSQQLDDLDGVIDTLGGQ